METDATEVLSNLARQVADLSVRLALAEAQVAAYQRAEVDRLAEEETAGD